MRTRMRDSARMRGSRSGRQEGGQGGLPGAWPTSFFSPRNWSLTASCQQRRGLRPGAPEAAEARLGHARSNSEGVARPAPQVAQYTLSASFQDLHLGFGGARKFYHLAPSEKMWELARRHLVSTLIMGTVLGGTQVTVSRTRPIFWLQANQIKDPQSQELTLSHIKEEPGTSQRTPP